MVKGNWQRRAELADIRRKEAKEKKAARSNKKVTAEGAMSRLRADTELSESPANVSVWLEVKERRIVCRQWFFEGNCMAKKCRMSHDTPSVCSIRGLAAEYAEDPGIEVVACQEPMSWRDVTQSDFNRIRYITVDNKCIYDHRDPRVWDAYAELRLKERKERSLSMGSLPEENDEAAEDHDTKLGDSMQDLHIEEPTNSTLKEHQTADVCYLLNAFISQRTQLQAHVKAIAGSPARQPAHDGDDYECEDGQDSDASDPEVEEEDEDADQTNEMSVRRDTKDSGKSQLRDDDSDVTETQRSLENLLECLDRGDLFGLLGSCRSVRLACLCDDGLKFRRREAMRDFNQREARRRKEDKKKAAKTAGSSNRKKKSGKKDGFARGGNH
jgi:hypothetical protein